MKSRLIRNFILMGTSSVLTACASPIVGTSVSCDYRPVAKELRANTDGDSLVGDVEGSLKPIPLNSVSYTDAAISNKILLQDLFAGANKAGGVSITARFINCTDFPQHVEGRTHFLDTTGRSVEPISSWKRFYLGPKALSEYNESSLGSGDVSQYLVEIREGS